MLRHILTLLFLCTAVIAYSQGWERIYSGGAQDEARDIAVTPDGGYIMTGLYANSRISLIKVDVDGFQQWTKNIIGDASNLGLWAAGNAIIVTQDSGYLIGGFREVQPFLQQKQKNAFLLKTDLSGNVLWTKDLGIEKDDEINDIRELADGTFVVAGYRTNTNDISDAWAAHVDALGNILWSKTIGVAARKEVANALTLATNGDIVVVGEQRDAPTIKDIYVVRLAIGNGSIVWEKTYSFSANADDAGSGIVTAEDGNFVIAGYAQPPAQPSRGALLKISETGDDAPLWYSTFPSIDNLNDVALDGNGGFLVTGSISVTAALLDLYVARTAADGSLIWATTVGKPGPDIGYAVMATPDGGSVAVGLTSSSNLTGLAQYAYMVKTDANGNIFTNYLSGKVFNDLNQNGIPEGNEPGMKKWLLEVKSPDFTRFITTNNAGDYLVMVDTGTYQLTLYAPNDYWAPTNVAGLTVPVLSFYDTIEANVGAYAAFACPRNEVDIQTPILRRCADNVYTVRYCNSGTEPSPNTLVRVEIDPALSITSSSKPYTLQDNIATFDLGLLLAGDCGNFTFSAFLDCATTTGQAYCVKAHIEPDTFCNTQATWDGAIIEARARCENDTVWLGLINRGTGPIGNVLEYVIIEDIVLLTIPAGQISDLAPDQETTVFSERANGKTYRIIAEQTAGYPGMSVPTAAIEGCKTDTTTSESSLGFFTMFPEDDAEPFTSADCQESYEASFNPIFLKRGHPKGYDQTGESHHFIESGTDIDYLIRFQNNTENTVNQVVVRDTLSPWLNPTTVRPGTASHPYDYTLYGTGIVQFSMTNLSIAPGAEGYVKFRVSQKADVPMNTEIWNEAQVYFDFNAPVATNQTLHTVGELDSFIVVPSTDIIYKDADLRVYPNPFSESVNFEVTGVSAHTFMLELYDLQGRLLFNQGYESANFQLFRHQIPTSGVLLYRLVADGKPVASGRLIRQKK